MRTRICDLKTVSRIQLKPCHKFIKIPKQELDLFIKLLLIEKLKSIHRYRVHSGSLNWKDFFRIRIKGPQSVTTSEISFTERTLHQSIINVTATAHNLLKLITPKLQTFLILSPYIGLSGLVIMYTVQCTKY